MCSDRWFRPSLNTMGRGWSRPRAQREQREQEETGSPGKPTPTMHPGKEYSVREPLTPTTEFVLHSKSEVTKIYHTVQPEAQRIGEFTM